MLQHLGSKSHKAMAAISPTERVEAVELMKLVKLSCSLSHGQAGSEKGFADTKKDCYGQVVFE